MLNLKYLIVLILITSCSLPNKEDLYSKSLDKTINKDLEGYGIMVVKFGDAIFQTGETEHKLGFGNIKICEKKDSGTCYDLSMYDQFGKAFRNRLRLSISGQYYAFKLKPGRYYIRQIQTGISKKNDLDSRFNNFNKSKYIFYVKESQITYIGDISIRADIQYFKSSSYHFTIQNNFKEAMEEIKRQNPLLDVSNAEVDLLKVE